MARVNLDALVREGSADGVLGRERVRAAATTSAPASRSASTRHAVFASRRTTTATFRPSRTPSASCPAKACSTGMCSRAHAMRCLPSSAEPGMGMARAGLEPATPRFSAVCSTNSATSPRGPSVATHTKRDVRTGATASRTSPYDGDDYVDPRRARRARPPPSAKFATCVKPRAASSLRTRSSGT